jgi:hypothetical protein
MENELTKLCVWRECRNEPIEGQFAVAHVINNRAKKQAKTYYEIVTAYLQFSSMTFHADPQLAMYPLLNDSKFKTICSIVDTVFKGTDASDPSQGATFYRNPKTATSIWFDGAVAAGKLVKTVTIGNHDFYKEVQKV